MDKAEQPTTQALKSCRYCGGQKRFQIVSPVSDHAWADCFCVKDRTTSLTAQEGLVEALEACIAEMADCIGLADDIIANNCGTDTPKDWGKALKGVTQKRAALSAIKEQHHD